MIFPIPCLWKIPNDALLSVWIRTLGEIPKSLPRLAVPNAVDVALTPAWNSASPLDIAIVDCDETADLIKCFPRKQNTELTRSLSIKPAAHSLSQ